MKVCTNCGASYEDSAVVCGQCGTTLVSDTSVGEVNTVNYGHGRNVAVALILTLVTCGIYGIYWLVKLNDSANELAGNKEYTSGLMVILFSLITCGIYAFYWYYKMGENVDKIKGESGNTSVIYLILGIFGLGIINYCLIQDAVNKKVGY